MRTTLLFILLSTFTFAQNKYHKTDSLNFVKNTNDIISKIDPDFKLISEDIHSDNFTRYYKYINSKNEILYINYYYDDEGKNVDLQRPGHKMWTISSIISNYMNIFNFYKKYYEKNADIERIQKIGTDWKRTQKEAFIRRKVDNYWEIQFN